MWVGGRERCGERTEEGVRILKSLFVTVDNLCRSSKSYAARSVVHFFGIVWVWDLACHRFWKDIGLRLCRNCVFFQLSSIFSCVSDLSLSGYTTDIAAQHYSHLHLWHP